MPLQPGTSLGPYEILSPIGAGGMGEVYKARDTRLDRTVAIKVLPEHVAADPDLKQRFEREAKTISSLNHPHICTLHDIGSQDRIDFLVMEYLEGDTLAQRLEKGALPLDQALTVAIEIADALDKAHRQGIVHRDIKPSNVMLTESGAKVLDFGIAVRFGAADLETVTRSTAAMNGRDVIAGTLPYMAPEVLGGEPADERSDIWSLGVLLYEAVTGALPFVGKNGAEVTSAILRDQPEALPKSFPNALPRILLRCLAKEPGRRYQRAGEVRAVMEAIGATTGGWAIRSRPDEETAQTESAPTQESASGRRRARPGFVPAVLSAVALAALLVGAYVVGWLPRSPESAGSAARDPIRSIAVLPFENLSGDPDEEFFVDGLHDALITDLAQLSGLRRVIARTSVLGYKDTDRSLPDIAQELGVDVIMTGSVLRVGDRVRISAQLIDASTEEHLWADRYERDLRDVFALQNEIIAVIAREIALELTPQEQGRLASARPVDPETHELYLFGRQQALMLTAESLERAVGYFEQAIERDPTYALAHAGLSIAYEAQEGFGGLGRGARTEEARAAALRAVELDPTLADGYASLANLRHTRDWDWAGAAEAFERALELNPNNPRALNDYAFYLTTMGRLDEAVSAMEHAVEVAPLSAELRSSHGRQLYRARRFDEAIEVYEFALQVNPTSRVLLGRLADVYIQVGRHEDAQAILDRLEQLYGPRSGSRGRLYAATGQTAEALAEVERLGGQGTGAAMIYAQTGLHDEALTILEAAVDARLRGESAGFSPFTLRDPGLDPVREDPRFEALFRRMGLPVVPIPAAP